MRDEPVNSALNKIRR